MTFRLDVRSFCAREVQRLVSRFSPGVARTVLWAGLAAWTVWMANYWAREAIATPPPVPAQQLRPVVDFDSAVSTAAASAIFGAAVRPQGIQRGASAALDIKLRGVLASSGGPTGAIVNTGHDDDFVLLEKELGPGVVLTDVSPTHIVITRDGVAERVELDPVKSEAARPKGAADGSGARRSHGRVANARADATEAAPTPAPEAEPAPAAPEATPVKELAPPMQNSQAVPDAWAATLVTDAAILRQRPTFALYDCAISHERVT